MGTILIGGKRYELIVDHKNGWNPSAFRDRYSDVLERYDYIIGDWGYNQLRLKGFFRDNNPKGTKDSYISGLVDYINEYCNFGCAYFVIHRHESAEIDPNSSEPDLLLTPPQTAENGAEEGVVALNENGEPIVLREHIRKPHPVRKEQSARPDRSAQGDGKDGGNRHGKAPQRKDGRISADDHRDSDDRWGGADRRGGDQPRGKERRDGDQQRGGGKERRDGDQPRSGGKERRDGDQPRGGGKERREGDQPRGGGSERREGEQPRSSGSERRGGDQPRGGGSERRGGEQPRGGGSERRGGEQPRGGGERRGGEQQRGGGERREGDQPRESVESQGESRRQTRFKQRKGQKRLPMPPREQTVAATSESALDGANRQRGGEESE
ncbi:YutD-like domain-containing protein [Paenibacillus kobensis]|uniref:YutD-like domain-containing protein n=1 Tax=Paenibacillus kobensis TaxID=59841 RepID=UPI001FEB94A0|nr:YutD-like domain-containing protein [Paenibacillus kobensis]